MQNMLKIFQSYNVKENQNDLSALFSLDSYFEHLLFLPDHQSLSLPFLLPYFPFPYLLFFFFFIIFISPYHFFKT